MDEMKCKIANGGASADIDAVDGFTPLQETRQPEYIDVEDDYEELATPKETDGLEVTIKAFSEEIQCLRHERSELQNRVEELITEKQRSEVRTRSLTARVAELEGELIRREEEFKFTSSKAVGALADADSLRLSAKALDAEKSNLETRVRDLETQIGNLQLENLNAVTDASRKEVVISSMKRDLNVEREKAITAEEKKYDEVTKMNGELEKWKKMLEMEREKYCVLEREKGKNDVCLNEELVVAREKANEAEIEKEKAMSMVSQKDDEINSLKDEINSLREELNASREKAIDDVVNLKKKAMLTMTQHDEVNVSLKEELGFARENIGEQLEMEKKAAASLSEKEREVVSLKQEVLLAREKAMDELQLCQATVDARLREENLEREIKQLKNINSELEGKIKGLQFQGDSDLVAKGIDMGEGKSSRISWVSVAAVAASSGTIAAAITAFCLRENRVR